MEFIEAIRGSKSHHELAAMVKRADSLLKATLATDEDAVATIVDLLHSQQTAPQFYNNEQALRHVVKMGYLSAIDHYVAIEEQPTGKGYADIVYMPRRNGSYPALVVELKWNHSSDTTIDQIKKRHYPDVLQQFSGNILLVGISYDEKTKEHTCKIEQIQTT